MLTGLDIAIGVLVLISALLATMRGFTREVLSLATWSGSALLAWYVYDKYPEFARGYIVEQTIADIVTIIGTFFISLIVLHLLTMKIADMVVDSKIGPLDRSLGFAFGGLRGLLLGVIGMIFASWLYGTGLPDWVNDAKSKPLLVALGDDLVQALPDNLEEQINQILRPKKVGASDDENSTDALEENPEGEDA